MCNNVEYYLRRQMREAHVKGASKDEINHLIREYNERCNPVFPIPEERHVYWANSFSHPKLEVFHLVDNQMISEEMEWSLIPFWCKDEAVANKVRRGTYNARSETMFDKPSFRASAKTRRGVILVESFYEYHQYEKKKYPFNIRSKDGEPIYLAVLWDEWTNKDSGEIIKSFAIVTVKGNPVMGVIHNGTRDGEPRMPLILSDTAQLSVWLARGGYENYTYKEVLDICQSSPEIHYTYTPVAKLMGNGGSGNSPRAIEAHDYPELANDVELQTVLQ